MDKNHVEITGTLRVLSPLHIGSGRADPNEALRRPVPGQEAADEPAPQLATVLRDYQDRPTLPATTLKGALRARLSEGDASRLFGEVNNTGESQQGSMGRLWIYAARFDPAQEAPKTLSAKAKATEHTYATARVRIDPGTGTAADHKLYHQEMVPPGTTFTFHARWLTNADSPSAADQEWQTVLRALAPLRHSDGLPLGRGTRQGQGRVRLDDVKATWTPWTGSLQPIPVAPPEPAPPADTVRRWVLTLDTDGPYLSHDPLAPPLKDSGAQNVLQPLRYDNDTPELSGATLLGALRARAAWFDTGTDDPDRVLKPGEEPGTLSPTQRLFGVTGWRGLLEIESLEVTKKGTVQTLTSVKLDRFSGAPFDGGLFSLCAFVGPCFTVSLRVVPRAGFPSNDDDDLIKKVLGDLKEMGLMLGHATNRGFGWFRVEEPEAVISASRPKGGSAAPPSPLSQGPKAPGPQNVGSKKHGKKKGKSHG